MSVAAPVGTCPHCGASNALGASFCLECGEAIDAHETPPRAPRPGTTVAAGGQRGPLIAVLIGLVLAAGAGAAYLATQDDEQGAGTPTQTEPASSSITGGTDTTGTDPTATGTDTTATDPTATDPTETEPTETEPPPDDWPAGTSAYTVILKSDSQATMDRSEAEGFAAGVTQGAAGVLNSDNYSSLNPGWWAVFLGQYDDADSAKAAAADLRVSYPGAYARYVAP